MDDANLMTLLARYVAASPARIICGIHNTPSHQLDARGNWRNTAKIILLRWLYPRAAAVVAVSEGVALDSEHVFKLPRERLSVIPNPVLTPELDVLAAQSAHHPWITTHDLPVLLACGRLTPQKDYPTLLRAFKQVQSSRAARLVILGEGELRQELEALCLQLGLEDVVDMPGFCANPYALMARCDLYVLSSRFEGSPVVLVEALACGARIISTDCPSGPSETLSGVVGARLVPVGDPDALASGILAMLADTQPAPGARRLDRFDYRTAARSYLDVAA